MIKEFAQHIENFTAWVIDEDLFVGHLPLRRKDGSDIPARTMLILENTASPVDGQQPDRIDKEFQVWNRAKTFFAARNDAYEIYALLHGDAGRELPVVDGPVYLAMVIDAVASPAPIASPDDKGLYIFSTNYVLRIENPEEEE